MARITDPTPYLSILDGWRVYDYETKPIRCTLLFSVLSAGPLKGPIFHRPEVAMTPRETDLHCEQEAYCERSQNYGNIILIPMSHVASTARATFQVQVV